MTINDLEDPTIDNCGAAILLDASASCDATASYSFTASDNCAGVGSVSCSPSSGTAFGEGDTEVTCSVIDANANSGIHFKTAYVSSSTCRFVVKQALAHST